VARTGAYDASVDRDRDLVDFADRYLAVGRVVGVRMGELDGKPAFEAQATDPENAGLPETFRGIPVVVRKFPSGPVFPARRKRPGPLAGL
jgi:hypothetical protein